MSEAKRKEEAVAATTAVNPDRQELYRVFEGSNHAISTMERVFKEHEKLETIILNPDSWVGKELLSQSKRLIDLKRDVDYLSNSINRLERAVNRLLDNTEK